MTRSELEILIKRRAAITVTVFAALLAINTMLGNSNSSRVLTNTIQANNMWAWYQAKNVRSVVYDVAGRADAAARMKMDMEDIMAKAHQLEEERDLAKERSPFYTYAGSALQLGIVLSTAAILAVTMPLFWASVGVGLLGSGLMAFGYFGV
jgi:uncharacterized SAM-dependent methyltransferase